MVDIFSIQCGLSLAALELRFKMLGVCSNKMELFENKVGDRRGVVCDSSRVVVKDGHRVIYIYTTYEM